MHDERGNGSVEWLDAPADYQRPVLEIAEEHSGLSIQSDETYNPYERRAVAGRKSGNSTTRTDLRKLSEWIKLQRQLEEAKRNNQQDEDD